jgi:hypothetical protein
MIEHMVLFEFKDNTGTQRDYHYETLAQIGKLQIPGISEITFGENFSARAQGYQWGLLVRCDSKAALERYASHPEHQRIVNERIKPNATRVLALDYDFS